MLHNDAGTPNRWIDQTTSDVTPITVHTRPIGGFVEEVEYEGELAEFVFFLRAAKRTGVVRQTLWEG